AGRVGESLAVDVREVAGPGGVEARYAGERRPRADQLAIEECRDVGQRHPRRGHARAVPFFLAAGRLAAAPPFAPRAPLGAGAAASGRAGAGAGAATGLDGALAGTPRRRSTYAMTSPTLVICERSSLGISRSNASSILNRSSIMASESRPRSFLRSSSR